MELRSLKQRMEKTHDLISIIKYATKSALGKHEQNSINRAR